MSYDCGYLLLLMLIFGVCVGLPVVLVVWFVVAMVRRASGEDTCDWHDADN